jgi:hypothetical protein
MHSCCCIYFILWCGFILFWFEFETLFEKVWKETKEKKTTYLLGPKAVGRPALPRLPAWAVQRRRVPAQQPSPAAKPAEPAARLSLSSVADGWTPGGSRVLFLRS